MQKSIAVLLLTAMVVVVSTSAIMADTWQVTAINDTGQAPNDIELTLAGTGGGITGPIAVNPAPAFVTFTAPPPFNELDANWGGLPLFPGQTFVADFNLTTGLTPSFIFGTWLLDGGPIGPVNPGVTTFTRVPEPSTMVLAGLAAAGLAVTAIRRRRHCNMGTR